MKSNKGFTLVEVIISIAVLSILCVVFLQLFVKANEISEASNQLDNSVTMTNTTMEILKGIGVKETILTSDYLDGFQIVEDATTMTLTKELNDNVISEVDSHEMKITLTLVNNLVKSNLALYDMDCQVTTDEKVVYEVSSQIILE